MDPGYVRDQPGKAPCGMDLVPVYEDEPGAAQEGAIAVDPRLLQSMGVRTAKAEVKEISRTIRAVGQVTYDERRLTVVTTKLTGWVERLFVKATGDPIRRGQTPPQPVQPGVGRHPGGISPGPEEPENHAKKRGAGIPGGGPASGWPRPASA
jgi:hypothetical protein